MHSFLKFSCLLLIFSSNTLLAEIRQEKITGVEYIYIERGNALYSQAGHSLLRIKKEVTNSKGHTLPKDLAYNWGVFNSRSANFAWEFYKGTLGYKLQVLPTKRYIDFIKSSRERGIHSYPLRFSAAELQRLQHGLAESRKNDTKFYDYHVWYNNCATKIRDLLDYATEGKFKKVLNAKSTFTSYRDYWFATFGNYASVAIGTAVLFNRQADRTLTFWEGAFLPEVLRDGIALYSKALQTDDNSESSAFMGAEKTLQEAGNPISAPLDGRLAAFLLLFALVLLSAYGLKKLTNPIKIQEHRLRRRAIMLAPAFVFLSIASLVSTLSLFNPLLTTREYFYLGSILAFYWPTDLIFFFVLKDLRHSSNEGLSTGRRFNLGMKYALVKWVSIPICIVYGIISGQSGVLTNGLVFGAPSLILYAYSWFLLRNLVQKEQADSIEKTTSQNKKAA